MSEPLQLLGQAVRQFQAGQLEEATATCRTLLQQDPAQADALGLLGLVAMQQRKFPEAAELFQRAIGARPTAAALHFHHGTALAAGGGRDEQAMVSFGAALRLEPKHAEAHHQLGNMLKRLHRYDEAIASLTEAARLAPTHALVRLNLGVAQLERGLRAEAIASFRRALDLSPDLPEAHNVLGAALMDNAEISAAQEAFAAALRLRPNYPAAHNNLARTFRAQGRLHEAVAEYRTALAIAPDPGTHSNLCYALNFIADISPDDVWREHQAWADRWGVPLDREPRRPSRAEPESEPERRPSLAESDNATEASRPQQGDASTSTAATKRRLRVGFVSPDLVNHAVAYFVEPLLAQRDRTEWEAFCYSDAAVPDRTTTRLKSLSDHWRDTATLRDEQLDAQIRRDQIDVLIDLAGHTAHNRLLVFARKPAAVQVTWLGYPNTTGLRAIDYRITDSISDPPGETERWHAEQLLRLPRAFLCYQPPEQSPAPRGYERAGVDSSAGVTFASFSNFAKVSEPCLKTWANLLRQVPDSRLILKSRGLGDPATAAQIHERFRAFGVTPDRVQLDGTLVSVAEHLRQYHAVDIALDPFPYNGTTTTCEALWMGVPVVTLAGKSHVARVGASLLTHLGRTEWITNTQEEYVNCAASLAADGPKLAEIHRGLRAEMQQSPLCNASGFARDFSAAVRDISRRDFNPEP